MTEERIREIINDAGYGDLATSVDGQPRIRPMAFVVMDDLRLWSSTFRQSGKVREMMENNRVEVCFVDSKKVQVRIEGVADLSGGADKKKKLLELNPGVGGHFSGENDPNFIHIEIVPTLVRWTEPGFGEYHIIFSSKK